MRDSKLYKVLRIIFLTLAIISLVFALAKKVGLAASDSSSSGVNSFPLPISFSYGLTPEQAQVLSQLDLDGLMATTHSIRNQNSLGYDTVCLVDWTNSNNFQLGFYNSAWTTSVTSESLNTSTVVRIGSWPQSITAGVTWNGSEWNYWNGNLDCVINLGSHLTALPDGSYSLNSNEFISYYPFYSQSDSISTDGGFLLFSKDSGGGGIDSPGWDDAFQDWLDDDLNPVDTSAPSNNTSTPAWLQSILNALGVLNNTVGGGFNLIKNTLNTIISFIGDLLQHIIDNVIAGFEALGDALDRIFNRVGTVAQNIVDAAEDAKDAVVDGLLDGWDTLKDFWAHLHEIFEWFYNHGLDSDHEWSFIVLFHYLFDFDTTTALSDFQANKYGDFILDIRDFFVTLYTSLTSVSPSQHVFFTISLGNHFGVQIPDIIISFDWYANVRDTFLPYLFAFIYVSAAWLFFKRLPDIIHGAASAESSFADAFGNNEFAPTSHGVFTKGVSKHQPSLDKSPISGGGGVHSGSSQFWY